MRVRWGLVAWGIGATVMSWLTWTDPRLDEDAARPAVRQEARARRLFPELSDRDVRRATFELQGPDGKAVRLVPDPAGLHHVEQAGKVLGPVDPHVLDGLWASLRMATALRAVAPNTDLGAGQRGVIRIAFPDRTMSLRLGREAGDRSGLYARLGDKDAESLVVESELSWHVDQDARSWLSRRVARWSAAEVEAFSWAEGGGLSRGADGLWRQVEGGEGQGPRILANEAVDMRLDRVLGARLEPLLEPDAVAPETLHAWMLLSGPQGETLNLVIGEACPGAPDRRVLSRGPGLLGCVSQELVEPWSQDDTEALLERRLLPHAYGRILVVELRAGLSAAAGGEFRRLRRRSGGWNLIDTAGEHIVAEDEVRRWVETIRSLELGEVSGESLPNTAFQLVFETDTTVDLSVRCGSEGGRILCARDGGPPRELVGETRGLQLDFKVETFADRSLLQLKAGDVRSVELLPGEAGTFVKQAVHLDLGRWKLDAPAHPDGDGALDEVRLEAFLARLSSLRAAEWAEASERGPIRRIELELTPGSERERVQIELFDDCVVRVDGGSSARIDGGACAVLSSDLLYDDPLRAWLRTARSIELSPTQGAGDRSSQRLRRSGETWALEGAQGEGLGAELEAELQAWYELRVDSCVSGEPPGAPARELRITRDAGSTVRVELGARAQWLRVVGESWWYSLVRRDLDKG